MCSGRYADIKLAGTMMHLRNGGCSDRESDTTNMEGQLLYKVSYETGVKLILTAANEYMDSSTLLDDETMVQAK